MKTHSDIFFVKKSDAKILEAEIEGLELLRPVAKKAGIVVPRVHSIDKRNGFLALEWMESVQGRENQNAIFGRKLAAMHGHESLDYDRYGFKKDNYIGLSLQRNESGFSWVEFFRDSRLRYMMSKLIDDGKWQDEWDGPFENLSEKLGNLLPDTPKKSVLHGDLWAGNMLFLRDNGIAFVDPSAYIGHSEVDLAMTQLFGGFDSTLLENYRSTSPLEAGWEERFGIYNLYHLMNHLLLFGDTYRSSVGKTILKYK